ncbi:MAG: tRNA pseudouridine(55) synthase TruB [Acidobacteria bacterium]|nr:tRNA pseudouridine(55) synthase TruB [Acidobacteriota bacterium]
MDGALVINKDRGMTSHDAVLRVRKLVRERSIGHLGTLDPIATGVLPLLVGAATRLQRFYTARRKRYEGRIRFGFATDTYDADGHALGPDTAPRLRPEQVEPHVRALTGKFEQTPPPYSAKKIGGVAAYERARRREKFTLKPVAVEVYRFDITQVEGSLAGFVIECAAGTYIRSLVHELGLRVGPGAHLAEISRTASGEFRLEQAVTLAELERVVAEERLPQVMIPLAELLPDLPQAVVGAAVERRLRHGGKVELADSQIEPARLEQPIDSEAWKPLRVRIFNPQRQLVAIAQAVVPRVFQPIVVLPESTALVKK